MTRLKEVITNNREMVLMVVASAAFAIAGLLIKDYELVGAGVGGLLSVGIIGTMIKINQPILDQINTEVSKINQKQI